MSLDVSAACRLVSSSLAEIADPAKAAGMAAYMKTDMPFYGVQKPARTQILRRLRDEFPPGTLAEYDALASALWDLSHREEKYLAQAVATQFDQFIVPDSMPLYLRFIVEGAWWDFVDETATHMVRELVLGFPAETWPIVDRWNESDDMWLRRASILCQIGAKERTDVDRLFASVSAVCTSRSSSSARRSVGLCGSTPRPIPRRWRVSSTGIGKGSPRLSCREATKHIGHLVPT